MTQSRRMQFRDVKLSLGAWMALSALLSTSSQAEPAWQRAQQLMRRGRYDEALHVADATARKESGRTPAGRAAVLLAARAETSLGLLANARDRLERASALAPGNLPLKAELCRVAAAQGDTTTVRLILESATRLWNIKLVDRTNPANLAAMATIAQHGQAWSWANELFREAVKRAPTAAEPNVAWGQLFLQKHAIGEAAASFKQALKADPQQPDALVGMARTELEKGYDRPAANAALASALAQNPRHAGALALKAEIALDGEDFAEMQSLVEALRTTNPHDADADWLSAAVAKIRSDDAAYAKVRDARLAIRANDGDFFANVAEALVRQRRYREARVVAEECLLKAPQQARCNHSLGNTLLRLGEEAQGLEVLRDAFAADPYNTRTFNQLQLFEKAIKNDYKIIETAHLRFRIRPQEQLAIERIVGPFLESVYERYERRYDYRPPTKVMFELYGDATQFAVRTVGVPTLDVSAVCFGTVITALAPSLGKTNWALVLSHELAHVFSLGLSRERVPRWLTEGLAEWETTQLKEEWRRHDVLALWGELKRKTLPPFPDLSKSFFNARSNEEAVAAYAYAAHAVEFLIARSGFAAVRTLLVNIGAGMNAETALMRLDTPGMADLQRDFVQHLDARYAALGAQFLPNVTERLHLEDALSKAAAPSATADDFARAALSSIEANQMQAAQAFWTKGDALWKAGPKLLPTKDRTAALLAFVWARLAEAQGAPTENIIRNLRTIIERGFEGYDVRLKLAMAAMRAGNTGEAQVNLQKAVQLVPEEVEGWMFLGEALTQAGKPREALAARIRAFLLDAQNGRQAVDLLQACERVNAMDLVLLLAPWVVQVMPGDPHVHALYGRALTAVGRHREAITEFSHALAFGEPNAAEIRVTLEQLHRRLGDVRPTPTTVRPPTQPPPPPRGPAPPLPSNL
ncbi:MAG: tetratricopeptide repeat protein [Deltaproteobacteria bacterium]|nr:tetratricopeptide repeat protein [Deltaproteobacteria bacterium]